MTRAHRPLTRRELLSIGTKALVAGTIAPLLGACAPVASGGPSAAPLRRLSWLVPQDPLISKFARSAIAPLYETAHPGSSVEVISPISGRYGQKLLVLAAGGLVPEVFTDWGGASFYTLWNRRLLADLTPFVQARRVRLAYAIPAYGDQYTVDGHLYAVIWNSNPNLIVYNKSLLDAAGVPTPPSSWDDRSWTLDRLLLSARTASRATGNPATATFGLILNPGTCGSLAWLWNADPFNPSGGPEASSVYRGARLTEVFPTRPEVVEAMTWLADLTLKHHVAPTPSEARALSSYGGPFFSGRVAMVSQAGGWLQRQAAVVQPSFAWGIAPYPFGPGGRNTPQREDNAWYVGRESREPELGFELILAATLGPGAQKLIEVAKGNPPTGGANEFRRWSANILTTKGFAMTEQDFGMAFQGGLTSGFADPTNVVDNAAEYETVFSQTMAPVWLGRSAPREGLQTVKQRWEENIRFDNA